MKYNLLENTKYLLRENYLLNEKYILAEASGATVPVNVTNIKKAYTRLEKIISGNKKLAGLKPTDAEKNSKDNIKRIDDIITMLDGELMHTNDAEDIKGKARAAVNEIEQILNSAGLNMNLLSNDQGDNVLAVLRSKANSSDRNAAKEIKSTSRALRKISNDLRNKATDTVTDKADSIREAETAIDNLKKFEQYLQNNPKHAISSNNLDNLLADCLSLSDAYIKNPNEELLKELRDLCPKLSVELERELKAQGFEATQTSKANEIDWNARFKDLKPEQFWQEYYTIYWAQDADKIAKLGKTFREQCEKLGFTEKTNPFITYLKEFLVKRQWTISDGTWAAINNASKEYTFIAVNFTKFEQKYNILYCKDLFSKSAQEAEEYLKLYKKVKDLDPKKAFDSAGGSDVAKAIVSHLDVNNVIDKGQFFFLIMYEIPGLELDKIHKVVNGVVQYNKFDVLADNYKLRPITDINHILQALDPDSGEDKKFTKDSLQQLIDDIDKLPTPPTDQAKYLRVIISKFMLDTDAADIYKVYPKINAATYTGAEEVNIIQFVYKYANKVTKDDVKQLLAGVNGKLVARDANYDLKK